MSPCYAIWGLDAPTLRAGILRATLALLHIEQLLLFVMEFQVFRRAWEERVLEELAAAEADAERQAIVCRVEDSSSAPGSLHLRGNPLFSEDGDAAKGGDGGPGDLSARRDAALDGAPPSSSSQSGRGKRTAPRAASRAQSSRARSRLFASTSAHLAAAQVRTRLAAPPAQPLRRRRARHPL